MTRWVDELPLIDRHADAYRHLSGQVTHLACEMLNQLKHDRVKMRISTSNKPVMPMRIGISQDK